MLTQSKIIDFEDIRDDLRDEAQALIDEALKSSVASLSPRMLHLCGAPGVGKSTYTQLLVKQQRFWNVVQFDTVMNSLSGYVKDRDNLGIVEAFALWELPARAIGYHLLQALFENRRDILFDHSATAFSHITLIEKMKAAGYFVEMHYIECTAEVALARVRARERLILRHTPESTVLERFALLETLVPKYQHLVHKFVPIQLENVLQPVS